MTVNSDASCASISSSTDVTENNSIALQHNGNTTATVEASVKRISQTDSLKIVEELNLKRKPLIFLDETEDVIKRDEKIETVRQHIRKKSRVESEYPYSELCVSLKPHGNDVLCGRGKAVQNHPGNIYFRNLMTERRAEFAAGPIRKRRELACEVLIKVCGTRPPGRFLKKEDCRWVDIGNDEALKKALQALREGAPYLSKQIAGNSDDADSDEDKVLNFELQLDKTAQLEVTEKNFSLLHAQRKNLNKIVLPEDIFKLMDDKKWVNIQYLCEKYPLRAASQAFIEDDNGSEGVFLPIHYACQVNAPLIIIKTLYKAYPDGVKMRDNLGSLPIHIACEQTGTSSVNPNQDLNIIQYLSAGYPEGIRVSDSRKNLPMHIACLKGASIDIIKCLHEVFPGSLKMRDKLGNLPIHWACFRGDYLNVIEFLRENYSLGLQIKNKLGHLPIWLIENQHHRIKGNKEKIIGKPLALKPANHTEQHTHKLSQSKASTDHLQPIGITSPKPRDVLCGHGESPQRHPGNDFFHSLVKIKSSEYSSSTELVRKIAIAQEIVKQMRSKSSNFLKKCADTNTWYDIGDEDTLKKTLHALNDFSRKFVFYLIDDGDWDDLQKRLKKDPLVAQFVLKDGILPIHYACQKAAPLDVIKQLYISYPEGILRHDKHGYLPIHWALRNKIPSESVQALLTFQESSKSSKSLRSWDLSTKESTGSFSPASDEIDSLVSTGYYSELSQGDKLSDDKSKKTNGTIEHTPPTPITHDQNNDSCSVTDGLFTDRQNDSVSSEKKCAAIVNTLCSPDVMRTDSDSLAGNSVGTSAQCITEKSESISPPPSLTNFDLQNRMIKAEDLARYLAQFHNLQRLNLSSSRVFCSTSSEQSNANLGDIGSCIKGAVLFTNALELHGKSITTLNLNDNKMDESTSAFVFAKLPHCCPNLLELDVSEQALSSSGVLGLCAVLQRLPSLRRLVMRNVSFQEVAVPHLCVAVKTHPSLCFLDVSLNSLSALQVATLQGVVPFGCIVHNSSLTENATLSAGRNRSAEI